MSAPEQVHKLAQVRVSSNRFIKHLYSNIYDHSSNPHPIPSLTFHITYDTFYVWKYPYYSTSTFKFFVEQWDGHPFPSPRLSILTPVPSPFQGEGCPIGRGEDDMKCHKVG